MANERDNAVKQPARRRRWPYVVAGALALVVLIVAIGVQMLDRQLLLRAREYAAEYSRQLGRPIEIGDLSTNILGGLRVRLEDLRLGAAEGEELPLATIERVDVRAELWPLLKSGGEDVRVRSVEIRRPELTVIRLENGSTNLEHLDQRLDAMEAEEPAPAEEAPPRDLSGVRLESFELSDGRIRLVDRTSGEPREVAINDLDVKLEDLRAGEPLEVAISAAVLAEKQNLNVTFTSTPLPVTLVPTPEAVAIRAEQIDLSPLASFLPAEAGFQGGTLDAALKARFGRAVPGGEGPTEIAGMLRALGLRFRDAEGGKALDVTVDADLSGDVVSGSLDLRKLEIAAGPARISGRGQVMDLASETPSIKGLEIVGKNLDPAALAAYYPKLDELLGGQIAGPIGLLVTASGTQEKPAVAFDLDFTQARMNVPDELAKAAGAPMRLNGTLHGASKGVYAFDVKADLKGADLRPGELLNKRPGDRFEFAGRGTLQPGATPRDPTRVKLSAMELHLLGDSMTGTASAQMAGEGKKATTTFEMALESARINADQLLLSDEEAAAANPSAAAGEPEKKDPDRFDGLRGTVAADIASLQYSDMQLSDVRVRLKMVDDEITLEQMRAGAFGGSVTADGTKVALGPEKWPFDLKLQARGVDLGAALARGDRAKKALDGSFNGDIALTGAGTEFEEIAPSLAGAITGTLVNGSFLGTDVVSAVSEPLARALPFAARALSPEGLTRLGDELPFGVTIENGVAKLKKPIQLSRPQASLTFDGGIKLDGELDLAGSVALTPQAVSTITAGRANLAEPLPIAVSLTGPAWKPKVGGLDVKPAVMVIAKHVAADAAGRLIGDRFGERGKAVSEAIKQGDPEQLKREAEQRLAEERARAEAKAREEAAKAKQRAEEEAKRRAEEEAKKRLKGILGR